MGDIEAGAGQHRGETVAIGLHRADKIGQAAERHVDPGDPDHPPSTRRAVHHRRRGAGHQSLGEVIEIGLGQDGLSSGGGRLVIFLLLHVGEGIALAVVGLHALFPRQPQQAHPAGLGQAENLGRAVMAGEHRIPAVEPVVGHVHPHPDIERVGFRHAAQVTVHRFAPRGSGGAFDLHQRSGGTGGVERRGKIGGDPRSMAVRHLGRQGLGRLVPGVARQGERHHRHRGGARRQNRRHADDDLRPEPSRHAARLFPVRQMFRKER